MEIKPEKTPSDFWWPEKASWDPSLNAFPLYLGYLSGDRSCRKSFLSFNILYLWASTTVRTHALQCGPTKTTWTELQPAGRKLMWCHWLVQVLFYNEVKPARVVSAQHGMEGAWGPTVLGSELWHLMMVLCSSTAVPSGSSGPRELRRCSATDCRRVRVPPSLIP